MHVQYMYICIYVYTYPSSGTDTYPSSGKENHRLKHTFGVDTDDRSHEGTKKTTCRSFLGIITIITHIYIYVYSLYIYTYKYKYMHIYIYT